MTPPQLTASAPPAPIPADKQKQAEEDKAGLEVQKEMNRQNLGGEVSIYEELSSLTRWRS